MRIDILHVRDPESDCDLEVYIDGRRVKDFELWDFDPGRGYTQDDIADMRQSATDSAPEFLRKRIAAIWDQLDPTYRDWSF